MENEAPASDDLASAASEIAQNGTFERFARAGFVVSGLMHLVIGYLAIRIALGSSGGDADQSGALATVSARPGGVVVLWVAVVAFLSMSMWRFAETALGRKTDPKSQNAKAETVDRVKALSLALVYLGLAYSTLGFARGAGRSAGQQNSSMTARLMQTTAGTVALTVGAVIIVAVGGYHVYKGVSRNFVDDLEGRPSNLVRALGLVGYVAKGLTIAIAGVLVIVAISRSEPEKATGLDGGLKALGAQPYGQVLLIAAGVGIITYGLYSFAMARYTKM